MTELEEIQAAMKSLCGDISSRATCAMVVNATGYPGFLLHPRRDASPEAEREMLHVNDYDWRNAIDTLRAKWDERSHDYAEKAIEAMGLAIVRLTYQHSVCTDAALRAEFDVRDIERYGSAAVERANAMAERGPFSITVLGGANDGGDE